MYWSYNPGCKDWSAATGMKLWQFLLWCGLIRLIFIQDLECDGSTCCCTSLEPELAGYALGLAHAHGNPSFDCKTINQSLAEHLKMAKTECPDPNWTTGCLQIVPRVNVCRPVCTVTDFHHCYSSWSTNFKGNK